jgi:hypothetical protein
MIYFFREPKDAEDSSVIKSLSLNSEEKNVTLKLKPNEIVLKKEIYRTEYAPYLTPGILPVTFITATAAITKKPNSEITHCWRGLLSQYSARRLIESLWASIKVITE